MYPQTYNPYYIAPYQQRLNQLEQPMYQQTSVGVPQAPQSASNIKGRVVASIEEARASQVDFDGSTTYFACPGEQKIYTKSIGLNGLPVFLTYELKQDIPIAQNQQKDGFLTRLEALEAKVKEISDGLVKDVTAGQ